MRGVNKLHIKKTWAKKDAKNIFESDLDPRIVQILCTRGIKNHNDALDFLYPDYNKLADPTLIPDMAKAVEVIKDAIMAGKKITVYGDYDVDGISATALLISFFKILEADIDYYIPSRHTEGYGLNREAIEKIAQKGTELIITVDCGSSAIEEVKFAKEKGIKVVITDHHTLMETGGKEQLPEADAIVNPKRKDSKLVSELAGVGVAYFLVRALQREFLNKCPEGQEKWLLDLVALGTICDVVPLTNDNRILASYGLKVLGKTKRHGIRALAKVANFDIKDVSSYQVGFLLGPRLNAAGRLETATRAIELLLTVDSMTATTLAEELNAINLQRQELTERIIGEAKEKIGSDKEKKIYILSSKSWPHGVVGIVASRLVEELSRPVLVMEETKDSFKGSARSIKNFDITEALSRCQQYLLRYGGHKYAAGFEIEKDKLLGFEKALSKIAQDEIDDEIFHEINIDLDLSQSVIDLELINLLNMLEPYGMGNAKPIFSIEGAKLCTYRLVGSPPVHLKMSIESHGQVISGMAFNYGEDVKLEAGQSLDMAISLEKNIWNDKTTAEFRVIDIKH